MTRTQRKSLQRRRFAKFLEIFSFVFSAFKDQYKKLYQTLERGFHQVAKHLEVDKKFGYNSFFNPLLGV